MVLYFYGLVSVLITVQILNAQAITGLTMSYTPQIVLKCPIYPILDFHNVMLFLNFLALRYSQVARFSLISKINVLALLLLY